MSQSRVFSNLSRRKFLQYSSLAAGTSILAACSGSGGSSDADLGEDAIKVGVMYSTTGTIAIVEKSLQDATFLAIEQINNGTGPWEANGPGIGGRKIQKVVVNPNSDWDLYNQMSKRLIDEDQVTCVLGCYTSASRKSVLPVFEEKDSILYYPVYYEGNECSSNVFYTGAAPNQQITDSIPYAYDNFGPKGFFVGSDYIYPKESNRIAIAELEKAGGEAVGDEYAALGTTEFITIINKIKAANPDFVLSNLVGDSIPAFYRQFKDAGINAEDIPIMAYPTTEEEIQAMGPEYSAGHYSSFNYFQTFFKAQAMKDIVEAGEEINTATLREATRGQEFTAPQGPVKMDPDNYHAYLYSRIGKWQEDGQAEIVFATDAAVKPIPWSQALYKGRTCVHATPDDRSDPTKETGKDLEPTFL